MGTVNNSDLCSIQYGLHGYSQQKQLYMASIYMGTAAIYGKCLHGDSSNIWQVFIWGQQQYMPSVCTGTAAIYGKCLDGDSDNTWNVLMDNVRSWCM